MKTGDFSSVHLVLFFSRNVSLALWDWVGMIEREVALYKRLQKYGIRISFITYGNQADLSYSGLIPGIQILCNRWRLPRRWFEILVPFLFAKALKSCTVIKTNQIDGAEVAIRSARIWKKPCIARCGYMFSYVMSRLYGEESAKARHSLEVERRVFTGASVIVVTTVEMQRDVEKRKLSGTPRIVVIPNYVCTDQFAPQHVKKDFDVVFVGRLSKEKNIAALLEVVKQLRLKALIIGTGELKQSLQEAYGTLGGLVQWHDRVPSRELPAQMNRTTLFVLPSLFEGHPKTLIEAMACGLPVIGANSPGIREIIRDGENGLLCGVDVGSIQETVTKLLKDPELQQRLARNARDFVVENFSLNRIVEKELSLLEVYGRPGNDVG